MKAGIDEDSFTLSYVADVYDAHPENEWQRLQRHRTELAVTLQALEAHLPPPPATILDIGGGPGTHITRRC